MHSILFSQDSWSTTDVAHGDDAILASAFAIAGYWLLG